MATAKKKTQKSSIVESASGQITIPPPNLLTVIFMIEGIASLLMNKFSEKAKQQMIMTQEAGSTAKKGKKREPKDFDKMYEAAKHISTDGWCGIPAGAFRAAMISACKTAGFAMTRAKLSVFVEADGIDATEGTPLVKITKGKPFRSDLCVRLATGVADIHPRPMWKPGWQASVTITYDADQFTLEDVANLMTRVGLTVGILEGRPDSKKSAGMGFGRFRVLGHA